MTSILLKLLISLALFHNNIAHMNDTLALSGQSTHNIQYITCGNELSGKENEQYIYLIGNGTIIGYFIIEGDNLITKILKDTENSMINTDNTYDMYNFGIQFFTREGLKIEWGGYGAQYIITDEKLALDVPCLNKMLLIEPKLKERDE